MSNELHMKMNTKNTKFLVYRKNNYNRVKIYLEINQKLKWIENFTYLENIINADGRSKNEIIKNNMPS